MASPVAERLITAEQFAQTVDPPGMRTELVRGRIVARPLTFTALGAVAARVAAELGRFIERGNLGESTGAGGYLLARNPDTVRAPNAAFISASRLPVGGIPEDEYFEGAPDLAVEVISPDDREADVAAKISDWLTAGSLRVWEVRPRTRIVTVHRKDGSSHTLREGESLSSDDAGFAVDGFQLPLSDVFA